MMAKRQPIADLLVRDGESVALVEHTVVRLSELATALLEELSYEDWVDVAVLSDALERRLGSTPPNVDAVAVTTEALRALEEQDIVTCRSL